MFALTYQERLTFHSETYLMRVANRPGQLLVNADYDRVLLLDLAARSTRTIAFAPAVDQFLIYSWIVAPDGSASYLISDNPDPLDFGLRLDHGTGATTRFDLPAPGIPILTELCWQTPQQLHIRDYQGQVWTLDSTRGIQLAAAQVLEQEPAKGYLTFFRQHHWGTIKGAEYGRGVYVRGQQQTLIGYFPPGLSEQQALLAPRDWDVIDDPTQHAIDTTHYLHSLFVCYEDKIMQHVGDAATKVLSAPEGCRFDAVNVVLVDEQPVLCVLFTMEDQNIQPGSFIDIYRLTPE